MGVFSGWQSAIQSAAATVANLVGQDIVARSISLTQAAASNAITMVTGARLKLGGGTTDYLESNGTTTVTAAGILAAGGGLVAQNGTNLQMSGNGCSIYFDGTGTNIYWSNANGSGAIINNISSANAGATAATAAFKMYPINALDAADWVFHVGTANNAASLFAVRYDGSIVQSTAGNSTGAPGNAVLNTPSGRSAFAGAAATCVITNSLVTATSQVYAALQTADGTLTSILRVVPGAGSFTVTGNAAATGTTNFCWFIVNPS